LLRRERGATAAASAGTVLMLRRRVNKPEVVPEDGEVAAKVSAAALAAGALTLSRNHGDISLTAGIGVIPVLPLPAG
jgi:hypothetical protein